MQTLKTIAAGAGLAAALLLAGACGGGGDGASDEAVRSAVREHIEARGGSVSLEDPRSGEPLELQLDHVHEGVEATDGGRHVVCVDFQGADGTVYDVDYYVDRVDGAFRVEDTAVHKAAGEEILSESERTRLEREG